MVSRWIYWVPMAAVSLAVGLAQARQIYFPPSLPASSRPPALSTAEENPSAAATGAMQSRSERARFHRRWLVRHSADLRDSVSQLQERIVRLAEEWRSSEDSRRRGFEEKAGALEDWQRLLKDKEKKVHQEMDSLAREKAMRGVEQEELALDWESFGMELVQVKAYLQAEKAFQRALLFRPDDPILHYNLGILAEDRLHRPKSALHHYRRFLALASQDPEAPLVRQWIRQLQAGKGQERR